MDGFHGEKQHEKYDPLNVINFQTLHFYWEISKYV